ncbi:MAG: prephenate dehydratase domain-containing protein [Propionibacteriaceae bacterium]|nr:prephenate dehydratase domain-containing protein [Propionibacteriaceae bacterium]
MHTKTSSHAAPADWDTRQQHFLVSPQNLDAKVVATLGPKGTSSEQAAWRFLALNDALSGEIRLNSTYPDAAEMVRDGAADVLVVANAFHGVNEFYMDPRLQVHCVFRMLTPLYGLACRGTNPPEGEYTIYSHPAPVPLIEELLPEGHQYSEVVLSSSTAEAAAQARVAPASVALTTTLAAKRNGLHIFSRQRCIEMVWTVFAASQPATAPPAGTIPTPEHQAIRPGELVVIG